MTDIRIAHFSDVHMALAPNRETIDLNRFFSWGNWIVRRKRHHSLKRLDRVLEMIVEAKPDVAICTGDFGHTGLPYEFEAVSEKFNMLTQNHIPMLVTGGNHDYYNRSVRKEVDRLQEKHGLGLQVDQDGICQLNNLMILLMHQGIYNPFYMARGRLSADAINSIESRIQSGQIERVALAAGHFPVCDAAGKPISIRKRLGGDIHLKQFLKDHQIPAYLCGHCHTPFSIGLSDGCVQYCAGSITNAGVLRILHYNDGHLVDEQTPTINMD